MEFQKDYEVFIKSIEKSDFTKAEEVFSSNDNKEFLVEQALEKLEEKTILKAIDSFRSIGSKRRIKELIVEIKPKILKKQENIYENSKVVLEHKKNKIKNKLYHLQGSSFENENVSKDALLLALEDKKTKKTA